MGDKTANEAANGLRYVDFEWNGTTYTMEFNRQTASYVEDKLGINVASMLTDMRIPLTKLPDLFHASLLMHHSKLKTSTANAMFEALEDKWGLMQALIELYSAAVNTLYDEPEEGKAISWKRH